MSSKKAIIVGAGPAGLTAALELLNRTDIQPIIIEKTSDIGGISKTVNYKGNRIDIGGHRFFSKSDRVMNWWLQIMQLDKTAAPELTLKYQNKSRIFKPGINNPSEHQHPENIMLVRKRVSRIYYLKKLFSYPITLSWDTVSKLGFSRIVAILASYMYSKLFPRKENSLEDFFINRFGNNLYQTFFKDYTEKVWGTPCSKIPPEWGAQRIKELSVTKALWNAVKTRLPKNKETGIGQKNTITTLIENFLYPKYGPGQLWEEVAKLIVLKGGTIHFNMDVVQVQQSGKKVTAITAASEKGTETFCGDYYISTMPVKDLIAAMGAAVPAEVARIAYGLQYRDFITIGLLVKRMNTGTHHKLFEDNWIYIQEKNVHIGRLQIFNNWSPFMVNDPDTVWLGLEYFANKNDALWQLEDARLIELAIRELANISLIDHNAVLDHTVIRMEKAYPAYFGAYTQFPAVRSYLDGFSNLFLVGRNGMHKYNNADHSMLTAMTAVDNIIANNPDKENIWKINTEQDYQE